MRAVCRNYIRYFRARWQLPRPCQMARSNGTARRRSFLPAGGAVGRSDDHPDRRLAHDRHGEAPPAHAGATLLPTRVNGRSIRRCPPRGSPSYRSDVWRRAPRLIGVVCATSRRKLHSPRGAWARLDRYSRAHRLQGADREIRCLELEGWVTKQSLFRVNLP